MIMRVRTFWSRNDEEIMISPDGYVYKLSDCIRSRIVCANIEKIPIEGSDDDIEYNNIVSYHHLISCYLCEKMYDLDYLHGDIPERMKHPKDVLWKLGYIFLGGCCPLYDMDTITEKQLRTMKRLGLVRGDY